MRLPRSAPCHLLPARRLACTSPPAPKLRLAPTRPAPRPTRRVLLNESRKDMLIDVAIAQQPDPTELVEVEATLRKVEGVLKKHLRHD